MKVGLSSELLQLGLLAVVALVGLVYVKSREWNTEVHWIGVTDKNEHPAVRKLKDHAHRFEEEPTIVFSDSESRLQTLKDLLQKSTFASNDIVVFADATSTMQVLDRDAIRQRFLSSFSKPVVIAGQEAPKGAFTLDTFPLVNPNVLVGRVWALRQFLESYTPRTGLTEQQALAQHLLRQSSLAQIDTKGELIVTAGKKSKVSALEWDSAKRFVTCPSTGTQPCIVQSEESVLPFYAFFAV